MRKAVDESLRALRVENVDLYQLHAWPRQTPIAESMSALAEFRDEGKVRYLGVSSFSAEGMQEALRVQPFCSNQVAYNLFDREIEADVVPFCAEKGVDILAHSSLAKGLLKGKYKPGHTFARDDERSEKSRFRGAQFTAHLRVAEALETFARAKGVTLIQLALAWLLCQPGVNRVLVGVKNSVK